MLSPAMRRMIAAAHEHEATCSSARPEECEDCEHARLILSDEARYWDAKIDAQREGG